MSIDAIQPLGAISPVSSFMNATDTTGAPADPAAGVNFGNMVAQGLQKLQDAQNTADDLAVEAATGRLTDVHDYIIAATEANLATSLTVAVRNKALDAFNEIMRMQA
ncbi:MULTISPECIES: flagellar hook-basal body complex protein FliE [Dactylosporangium]|uniref:Flagellar hook-basal body complex protein FliE n=2 Tax=Dactylosporangium TaxID=35753 RepID=A0A9W6NS40_9ACTN|nr:MULTISPECIES: flagellar hook-basal body complex protein FliE [Dactylosporangium]UAB95485.1 flagellar hook-basal body complex protein FliE [Dactylosporangium vinaceum]UWZ43804.1 flagellar hook-basal body complex protein FliE [Dactylosporangium matsuzakiense]GLL07945.1 flagellar hook-basal body complex protein FliE [Dactylosporangium matsuzakiense]